MQTRLKCGVKGKFNMKEWESEVELTISDPGPVTLQGIFLYFLKFIPVVSLVPPNNAFSDSSNSGT